jgi:hypothetical protein
MIADCTTAACVRRINFLTKSKVVYRAESRVHASINVLEERMQHQIKRSGVTCVAAVSMCFCTIMPPAIILMLRERNFCLFCKSAKNAVRRSLASTGDDDK